jgi:hypothetical protein
MSVKGDFGAWLRREINAAMEGSATENGKGGVDGNYLIRKGEKESL